MNMALLGNGLTGNIITGVAIGIGVAILSPVVIPVVASVAKPLTKAAIKSGILMFEKGRETFSELSEMVEDVIAEAKAELAESRKEATVAAPKEEPSV
jgi:hypothetical protein